MKTMICTFAAAMLSIGTAQATDWENAEFFPFEEATLVYKSTGMQTGTMETLIRKHGRETAQFQDLTMNVPGAPASIKTASWTDPDWVYTYDYTSGTGTKLKNPIQDMLANAQNPKEAYKTFLTGLGATEQGTDTHNGTPCTKYEVMMTTICISDDMIMQYTRMNMMGMSMNIELESIKVGIVDDSRFEKPDVPFNEIDFQDGAGLPGAN